MPRCDWALSSPEMQEYHDYRWGRPLHEDERLYEYLLLEMMQAGLSWEIILKKRQGFAMAFDQFDYRKIAHYSPEKIAELCQNSAIVRNRMKIEAAVNNAQRFVAIQEQFGSFDQYIWSFTNGQTIHHHWTSVSQIPSQNELSQRISKDLKKRGFKFVGPVIVYSYLQAIGIINDHLIHCPCYQEIVQDSQC